MIEELEIEGYIPLKTKGCNYIKLDTNALVNILMGRNGFGKTSILKMCSLTVPDSSDFEDGGYRRIIYLDGRSNQRFELMSRFGKDGIQSFKIDGVEQNDSNNQTVQKEMCQRHFKMNAQINRYLNGLRTNDLFTFLSPLKRKELIMEMYPNDVTYAVNVYNKIKAEHRNTEGAIKAQIKRLAEEVDRVNAMETMSDEELDNRIKGIEQEIKDALVLQGTLAAVRYNPQTHAGLLDKFNRLVNELASDSMHGVRESKEELLERRSQLTKIADMQRIQLSKTEDVVMKLSESLSGLNFAGGSILEVEEQLKAQERLTTETDAAYYSLLEDIGTHAYFSKIEGNGFDSLIETIGESLINHLMNVVEASNPNMTLAQYRGLLETAETLTTNGRGLKQSYLDAKHEVEHYERSEFIDCPKCNEKFKRGFDPKNIDIRRTQMEQARERMVDTRAKLDEVLKAIALDEEWYASMNTLVGFIRQHDRDNSLMNMLAYFQVGQTSTDELINWIRRITDCVKLERSLAQQTIELNTLRVRYKALNDNDIATLSKLFEDAENRLQELSYSLSRIDKDLADIEDRINHIDGYYLRLDALGLMREDVMRSFHERSQYDLRRTVDYRLSLLTPKKDEYVSQLIRTRSNKSVIQSMEDNLVYLKDREAKLRILMNGLCPNKGLIAKHMTDFIEVICGNMNAVIKEIFSTPLYIRPCQKSNGDLNYLFPVINGEGLSKPAKDVSECSGGESDVINYAFRRVLIRYINKQYPLFLDEVGIKLDAYHQTRFFDHVRRTALSGEINQIFMVSHYTTQVSMFDFANVIALNSDGITLPKNVSNKTIIR